MRGSFLTLGCVSLLLGFATMNAAQDASGRLSDPDVTAALRYAAWPKVEGEVRGYSFEVADYAALTGFKSYSEDLGAHVCTTGHLPTLAVWLGGRDPYRFIVTRRLKLKSDSGKELSLAIAVAPSVHYAHRWIIEPLGGVSSFIGNSYVLGAENDLPIADVCILRDPPANRRDWDPRTAKSLFFIRNNVVVDISGTGSGVDVVALARAMDAQIELQRAAANGDPERPEVELGLGAKTVRVKDFSPDFASVDVNFVASWDRKAELAKVFAFSTREADNFKTDDDGESVPDDEQPKTFVAGFLRFDDASKPTRIEQITPGKDGKHHVGIAAWGPNLLPKVIYVELEVVGRDR